MEKREGITVNRMWVMLLVNRLTPLLLLLKSTLVPISTLSIVFFSISSDLFPAFPRFPTGPQTTPKEERCRNERGQDWIVFQWMWGCRVNCKRFGSEQLCITEISLVVPLTCYKNWMFDWKDESSTDFALWPLASKKSHRPLKYFFCQFLSSMASQCLKCCSDSVCSDWLRL